jgi:hypothetical protein
MTINFLPFRHSVAYYVLDWIFPKVQQIDAVLIQGGYRKHGSYNMEQDLIRSDLRLFYSIIHENI